jgi:hypothetical protein
MFYKYIQLLYKGNKIGYIKVKYTFEISSTNMTVVLLLFFP